MDIAPINLYPGAAKAFTASLADLRKEFHWQNDTMSKVLDRIQNGFIAIQNNMAPNLADHVAEQTLWYLDELSPAAVDDIGDCLLYKRLSKRTPASASISYPDWFYLSCIYGPGNCRLEPFRV
jgi:hypothetical protein